MYDVVSVSKKKKKKKADTQSNAIADWDIKLTEPFQHFCRKKGHSILKMLFFPFFHRKTTTSLPSLPPFLLYKLLFVFKNYIITSTPRNKEPWRRARGVNWGEMKRPVMAQTLTNSLHSVVQDAAPQMA
jgi:hypothetical protein